MTPAWEGREPAWQEECSKQQSSWIQDVFCASKSLEKGSIEVSVKKVNLWNDLIAMWWASHHNPTVLTQIKRTKFWLSPAHCCASVCLWCAPAENWALVRLRRPLEAPPTPSSTCAPKGLQAAEHHMWPTEQGADPFLDEHAHCGRIFDFCILSTTSCPLL